MPGRESCRTACLPRVRGDRPPIGGTMDFSGVPPPRARGSTRDLRSPHLRLPASPACAGIDPDNRAENLEWASLPRVRGDRPQKLLDGVRKAVPPPRARGSTHSRREKPSPVRASPACAGIDHSSRQITKARAGLPRVRGDRPPRRCRRVRQEEPPPRARGSTFPTQSGAGERRASPACAGIDLRCQQQRRNCARLPRVRGDRPSPSRVFAEIGGPPPRARGSTRII